MADAETENLERLWALFSRFQFYIFGGLALVLTAIFGFTYQHSLFDDNRDSVNAALFSLLNATAAENKAEAMAAYEELEDADNFPELRNLGAFALVSLYVAENNYADAAVLMRDVVEETNDDGLRRLAVLRLSEVLINVGEYDEATQVLEEHEPSGGQLAVLFRERMGDAAFVRGDYDAARDAYNDAVEIATEQNLDSYFSVLLIKLGALLSEETPAAVGGVGGNAAGGSVGIQKTTDETKNSDDNGNDNDGGGGDG